MAMVIRSVRRWPLALGQRPLLLLACFSMGAYLVALSYYCTAVYRATMARYTTSRHTGAWHDSPISRRPYAAVPHFWDPPPSHPGGTWASFNYPEVPSGSRPYLSR